MNNQKNGSYKTILWTLGVLAMVVIASFSGLWGYSMSINETLSCAREEIRANKANIVNITDTLKELKEEMSEMKKNQQELKILIIENNKEIKRIVTK